MENHMHRLSKLAQLAKSTSLRDREQIERIIQINDEADDSARKTAAIIEKMIVGNTNSHED
jgi:hypothetical protein